MSLASTSERAVSDVPSETPTRVRYGVLAFACALSMITYLDRVCFGAAAPDISKDLGLNSVADLKWAFSFFAFAYAAFEVPSGWFGDVYGPRGTLIRIVVWWSLFTALTGLIGMHVGGVTLGGLTVLVVIRFLFGMGEAGAYPNITRALHNWFPYHERGFTQGMVWMSGRLMGGLTPLIWGLLVAGTSFSTPLLNWRGAFWLFGAIGLAWCVLFAIWFRNTPGEKRTVNKAELQLIQGHQAAHADHSGVPWRKILSSGNLWVLCLMYFCAAYGWYFNITYLHSFLEQQYGVDSKSLIGAVYKGGPLWLGAVGCLAGGYFTDWFIRRTGNQRLGRRLLGFVGHSLCAVCYFSSIYAPSAFTFFLAISFAAFFNDLTMGSAWATCQDIGRRYAAIAAGFMNMVGNFGGFFAGWLTGSILEGTLAKHADKLGVAVAELSTAQKNEAMLPGYHLGLLTFGGAYCVALVCWLVIDATKPIVADEK